MKRDAYLDREDVSLVSGADDGHGAVQEGIPDDDLYIVWTTGQQTEHTQVETFKWLKQSKHKHINITIQLHAYIKTQVQFHNSPTHFA